MTTRKIAPYFYKEVKETSRWALPSGNDPAYFCSGYFPSAAGNNIQIADTDILEFNTADVTIDFWIKFETILGATNRPIFQKGLYTGGTGEYDFIIDANEKFGFRYSTNGGALGITTILSTSDSTAFTLTTGTWYHVALVRQTTNFTLYVNGMLYSSTTTGPSDFGNRSGSFYLGNVAAGVSFYCSNFRFIKSSVLYTKTFQLPINPPENVVGTSLLTCNDTTFVDKSSNALSITVNGSAVITNDVTGASPLKNTFSSMMNEGTNSGQLFTNHISTTYSLPYTATFAAVYSGGVLGPNGDIHFVPTNAIRGQKISAAGVVSTYSLVYTNTAVQKHQGGVLATNGDVHFIIASGIRGQKISASGVVSTYSLIYTTTNAYYGGVLAPNGDIHFVPQRAAVGQKISSAGTVSTYSLVYTTTSGAYMGGVLSLNGDIHFIPQSAPVGQKISATGTVSTYSLVYTTTLAYGGGVLAPNGDIHFIPISAAVGQKISAAGVVSTYSLVYTTTTAYRGGVLAPNGDIHFIPFSANRGQKISSAGVVSTYSLAYTTTQAYTGGILTPNGEIQFIPQNSSIGEKITLNTGVNFSKGVCMSPFFNKL